MQENTSNAATETTQNEALPKANATTVEKAENAAEPQKTAESANEKKVRPQLFFSKDELIPITVTGFYSKETGQLEFVVPEEQKDTTDAFIAVKHIFRFSRVPYNRLNLYRSQSMKYSSTERSNVVDVIKLRDYFWTFHLRDWNIEDNNGEKIHLVVDPDGTLSDGSLEKLYELPASILDTVITLFERKLNIA